MLTHNGLFTLNPRLVFRNPDPGLGGGDPMPPAPPAPSDPPAPPAPPAPPEDLGFPRNTPVKDMTLEQQNAYILHQSRKHEDRVKEFGEWTPEKIAQLEKERDDLRKANQSAEERAIEDAKEAGRNELRPIILADRIDAALNAALVGRTADPMALVRFDRTEFAKGLDADAEKIAAWVETHSVPSDAPAPPSFPNLFQGRHESVTKTAKEIGEAEAAKRFGKPKTP